MGILSSSNKFGKRSMSRNISVILVLIVVIVLPCAHASSSVSNGYSKKFYQSYSLHQPASLNNASSSTLFEPRDGGGSSFGSSGYGGGGGGAYDMGGGGGYGAPMSSPAVYKYQIYPNPPMMQSMGWGGGMEDDDDDKDFPKELIGLLGLKGLKGLKGLLVFLKLLKLLKIPLLPILLPLLLPLFLLKLALLLIPLALILLIPVPVISTGRKLLESTTGQDLKTFLKSKLDSILASLPEDLTHIVQKIEARGLSTAATSKTNEGMLGETGKVSKNTVYVSSKSVGNIPPLKSLKMIKSYKNKTLNSTSSHEGLDNNQAYN